MSAEQKNCLGRGGDRLEGRGLGCQGPRVSATRAATLAAAGRFVIRVELLIPSAAGMATLLVTATSHCLMPLVLMRPMKHAYCQPYFQKSDDIDVITNKMGMP